MNLYRLHHVDCLNADSLEIENDFILTSSDVIVIFQIYDQFGAIQEPDSERMVCNTYIFIISNFLLQKFVTKTENRTRKPLTQLAH